MKFSVRELLLVTVIVALVLRWDLDTQRLTRDLHELRMERRMQLADTFRPKLERVYPGGPFKSVDWQAAMEKDDAIFGRSPLPASQTRLKIKKSVRSR